jgi:hypothetical protein
MQAIIVQDSFRAEVLVCRTVPQCDGTENVPRSHRRPDFVFLTEEDRFAGYGDHLPALRPRSPSSRHRHREPHILLVNLLGKGTTVHVAE